MGFHWTRCNPLGAAAPIAVLILCAIIAPKLPIIIRDIMHGIEWCCAILAAGMVLSSAIFALLMRGLMPHHVIFIRGNPQYFTMEAPNEYESLGETGVDYGDGTQVPNPNRLAILPRSSYEWQAGGQLNVHKRRNPR